MDSRVNLYVHRENTLWAKKAKYLPVTLVTGFLGAGKTTLLRHILTNKHNLKIAAAVNDFAEVNIDSKLVKETPSHNSVVELTNGCLCCSIAGEFRTAVWKLLQDADIGKINYLVIETSGVTDPQSTISTLEEEYGKMYRIRLDVVVTVVDTDALVRGLIAQGTSGMGSAAADSQLKCADVVLLNKTDLLSDEEVEKAKQFVDSYVPGAKVYTTKWSAISLHHIMEVEEVKSDSVIVTHEVVESSYRVNETIESKNRQQVVKSTAEAHLKQDEFASVVYQSATPFDLAKFQAFLGPNFPPSISRMKGTVFFQENKGCLYNFHMSGRNRYELSPCASSGLQGALSVQLVAIGKGLQPELVNDALGSCSSTSEDLTATTTNEFKAAQKMILDDDRFELMSPLDGPVSSYIDYRLLGNIEYGVTPTQASKLHGINFNKMNTELAKRLNGSSGHSSVLLVMLPSGVMVCRHCVTTNLMASTWKEIQSIASKVVAQFYRAVGLCKCGF